jgi:Phage integrase family
MGIGGGVTFDISPLRRRSQTHRNMTSDSRRLAILTTREINELYGLPCFTDEERCIYFDLSPAEHDAVERWTLIYPSAEEPADIVFLEYRQRRNRVANRIDCRVQGFYSQVIAGGGLQCGVADPRYLRHLPKPHVGAHGDNAGEDLSLIRFMPEVDLVGSVGIGRVSVVGTGQSLPNALHPHLRRRRRTTAERSERSHRHTRSLLKSNESRRRISPHTFRHTSAVHLLEAGVEANVIRGWLGHVSLETTNRYAEINLRMKQAALQACQPPASASSEACLRKPIWREDAELLKWLKTL